MKKTTIAAMMLMLPLATMSAKADVVTNYQLSASMNIGLASADDYLYNVGGSFTYDATTNSIPTWGFRFSSTALAFVIGTNDPSPDALPAFADANDNLTSFQFWEGSSTSYPGVRSFTFDIADPLVNGSEPIEDASYFGANESTGNTFHSGTLSATTTGVDEPSTLMVFAFVALAMLGWRSRRTFTGPI
jgi:hypothetical protein